MCCSVLQCIAVPSSTPALRNTLVLSGEEGVSRKKDRGGCSASSALCNRLVLSGEEGGSGRESGRGETRGAEGGSWKGERGQPVNTRL